MTWRILTLVKYRASLYLKVELSIRHAFKFQVRLHRTCCNNVLCSNPSKRCFFNASLILHDSAPSMSTEMHFLFYPVTPVNYFGDRECWQAFGSHALIYVWHKSSAAQAKQCIFLYASNVFNARPKNKLAERFLNNPLHQDLENTVEKHLKYTNDKYTTLLWIISTLFTPTNGRSKWKMYRTKYFVTVDKNWRHSVNGKLLKIPIVDKSNFMILQDFLEK